MVTLTRFFGFYKESYKIIVGWKKIFTQITLTLILLLSFIFLIHIQLSNTLFFKQSTLTTISEWITFWLFNFLYFTFLLSFSLLPTSAVLYTVASVYTAAKKDVTFTKVMTNVPRVWKKLMEALISSAMVDFFIYSIISLHFFIILELTVGRLANFDFGFTIFLQLAAGYVFWLVHFAVIWEMEEDAVMTVLDLEIGDLCEIGDAMAKSIDLMMPEFMVFKLNNVPFFVIPYILTELTVQKWRNGSVSVDRATVYGILCFLLLTLFFLFGLVMQTVLYFVYKHQEIENFALSDHLEEAYPGDYVPLKDQDVEEEQCQFLQEINIS